MSAQVFVDGGWIGLRVHNRSRISTVSTAFTAIESLQVARDLISAAEGRDSALIGVLQSIIETREAADAVMPLTPNGIEFDAV